MAPASLHVILTRLQLGALRQLGFCARWWAVCVSANKPIITKAGCWGAGCTFQGQSWDTGGAQSVCDGYLWNTSRTQPAVLKIEGIMTGRLLGR